MLNKLIGNAKQIVTTSLGIIGAALVVLTTLGYITPDQSNILLANTDKIISGVLAIALIFVAKD